MISHPHEVIFHPRHANTDKEAPRLLCFTSTFVVPARSKVHLKEWMSEASRSTGAWMGSLSSCALLLCGQESKSLNNSLWSCSYVIRTEDEEDSEVAQKQRRPGITRNNDFLHSSSNSEECVTRQTWHKNIKCWRLAVTAPRSESNKERSMMETRLCRLLLSCGHGPPVNEPTISWSVLYL